MRVRLTEDIRNPVTGHVSMEAGHLGTVVREATGVMEDAVNEVIVHWDGTRRPVRTARCVITPVTAA